LDTVILKLAVSRPKIGGFNSRPVLISSGYDIDRQETKCLHLCQGGELWHVLINFTFHRPPLLLN